FFIKKFLTWCVFVIYIAVKQQEQFTECMKMSGQAEIAIEIEDKTQSFTDWLKRYKSLAAGQAIEANTVSFGAANSHDGLANQFNNMKKYEYGTKVVSDFGEMSTVLSVTPEGMVDLEEKKVPVRNVRSSAFTSNSGSTEYYKKYNFFPDYT